MTKVMMVLGGILILAVTGCNPVDAPKNNGNDASKATIEPLKVQMKEVIPEKEYLGGWGYNKDSAVVLVANSELTGIALERPFLRRRSWREVSAVIEKAKDGKTSDLKVIAPKVKGQHLVSIDDKTYDRIQYEVYVELASGTNFTYDAECWFDITSFFGK